MDCQHIRETPFEQQAIETDVAIVGGGINGLFLGCRILESQKSPSIYILEKGLLPMGASSKNAGMGSFGSFVEFIEEINENGLEKATNNLRDRYRGLTMLLEYFKNDPEIFKQTGGYDIIESSDLEHLSKLRFVNDYLHPLVGCDLFQEKPSMIAEFGLNPQVVKTLIFNPLEWQINTGRLLTKLLRKFQNLGGVYLTGCEVVGYGSREITRTNIINDSVASESLKEVQAYIRNPDDKAFIQLVNSKKLIFCVNGFSKQVDPSSPIVPTRGQVMITKPISSLNFETNLGGTHGYYYMRTVNNRIIFGGSRHLCVDQEATNEFHTPQFFKDHLPRKLAEWFPNLKFEVDFFWSGIMGFQSSPDAYTIRQLAPAVYQVFGCQGNGMSLTALLSMQALDRIFGNRPKL